MHLFITYYEDDNKSKAKEIVKAWCMINLKMCGSKMIDDKRQECNGIPTRRGVIFQPPLFRSIHFPKSSVRHTDSHRKGV